MMYDPVLIRMPVADRVRPHVCCRDGLGLDAIGELADDGVPEPLLFVLNPMSRLMLVLTGGFGWVIDDHEVAAVGTSECVLGIGRRRRQSDRRAGTQGRRDRCHASSSAGTTRGVSLAVALEAGS